MSEEIRWNERIERRLDNAVGALLSAENIITKLIDDAYANADVENALAMTQQALKMLKTTRSSFRAGLRKEKQSNAD